MNAILKSPAELYLSNLSPAFLSYLSDAANAPNSTSRPCKICGTDANLFDVIDIAKTCHRAIYPTGLVGIPIYYSKCTRCDFIFTDFFDKFDNSLWQNVVYNKEYYQYIDTEYQLIRPVSNARFMINLIGGRKNLAVGLDYGGGNGQTARLLRASGYIYDSYDPFGAVEVSELNSKKYNVCSSFEVFEHASDPCAAMADIIRLCSAEELLILISTTTNDKNVSDIDRLKWVYAAPRNGHISLFSKKSLQLLADKFSLKYISVSSGSHLFTRGWPEAQAHKLLLKAKLLTRVRALLSF